MLPADTSVIRLATEHDADDLRRLAALDSARPLTGRILLGEIEGVLAAARSLETGRTIADPFLPTARPPRTFACARPASRRSAASRC